ncbi:MAG: hypothetical protein GYA20_10220, partial [Chloroflexi bacterium]|nr:hypothetical protein [Chloroflexota bacterium]
IEDPIYVDEIIVSLPSHEGSNPPYLQLLVKSGEIEANIYHSEHASNEQIGLLRKAQQLIKPFLSYYPKAGPPKGNKNHPKEVVPDWILNTPWVVDNAIDMSYVDERPAGKIHNSLKAYARALGISVRTLRELMMQREDEELDD